MKQNNIDIYKLINKNVLITGAGKEPMNSC